MVPGSADAVRVLRSPESLAEVVANPPASVSFVVDESDGVGSQKTWMPNHEDEDSAVSKHAPDRCQRCCKVRDLHQPKLACGDVERRVIERVEDLGVVQDVSERVWPSVPDSDLQHGSRAVHTKHLRGSRPRERPGHEALPASDIEHPQTANIAEQTKRALKCRLVRPAPRLHQFVIPRGDVRPCRTVRLTHVPDSRTEIGPGHGLPTPARPSGSAVREHLTERGTRTPRPAESAGGVDRVGASLDNVSPGDQRLPQCPPTAARPGTVIERESGAERLAALATEVRPGNRKVATGRGRL